MTNKWMQYELWHGDTKVEKPQDVHLVWTKRGVLDKRAKANRGYTLKPNAVTQYYQRKFIERLFGPLPSVMKGIN